MKSILTITLSVFLGIVVLFYLFQRQLVYVPNQNKPSLTEYNAEDMQSIELVTEDGLFLYAWYKSAVKDKPTILYMHGNAGHIGNRMTIVRPLLDQGYGVLLLEYRGYGGNEGRPSEKGLYRDAHAAIRFLQQQSISKSKIVYYGESLGAGVATQMAIEHTACALILQTPFTSLTEVAHFHYPWLFFLSPWDKYDSINKIQSIHMPLLIIHGTSDRVIPYEEGAELFRHALEPKEFLTLKNYDHHNVWNDVQFIKVVARFLERYCAFADNTHSNR